MLIGIDIGGTKCAVSLGNEAGQVLEKRRFPTPANVNEAIEKLLGAAEELAGKAPAADPVRAAGISCGGPLNEAEGIVLSPPNLPGWDRIPVKKLAEDRLKVPAGLMNDANACALAEYRLGAGRGAEVMVFMTFGTGLGAGIVIGGRLLRGANGNGGELGHIRLADFGPAGYGKAGSFEGFCSGSGLRQLALTLGAEAAGRGERVPWFSPEGANENVNAKMLQDQADTGEPAALKVYSLCGRMLGKGLAIVVDMLNPDRIIIGSIFARARHLLEPEMYRTLEKEALPQSLKACTIVPPELGEGLGDAAALTVAAITLDNTKN